MAKINPEFPSDSEHLKLGKVDRLRSRKIPKALRAIVMGVLLALSADAETAQGQDVATYSEGKCRLAYYDSVNAVYVTVAIAENVLQPDCNLSSKFTPIEQISGYSQDQPVQQPAVVATEAVIVTTNQGEGQASAQQPNNQGEFVQAVATPLAVNAQPAQAEDGADKGFFELLFGSNCQATLEKFDCDYGSDSDNSSSSTSSTLNDTSPPAAVGSEASASSTQADSTQPTAGSSETALKLDRVDVKPGQALVGFSYEAVAWASSMLSTLAGIGAIISAFWIIPWMWRRRND